MAKPRILLVTVPHTGTNSLERCFRGPGFPYTRRHSFNNLPGKDIWNAVERFPHDEKAITLRHPQDTWLSWVSRENWGWERFMTAWTEIAKWAEKYRPWVFPMDQPAERDRNMELLGNKWGKLLVYEGYVFNKSRVKDPWERWWDLEPAQWEEIWSYPLVNTRYKFNPEFSQGRPEHPERRIRYRQGNAPEEEQYVLGDDVTSNLYMK